MPAVSTLLLLHDFYKNLSSIVFLQFVKVYIILTSSTVQQSSKKPAFNVAFFYHFRGIQTRTCVGHGKLRWIGTSQVLWTNKILLFEITMIGDGMNNNCSVWYQIKTFCFPKVLGYSSYSKLLLQFQFHFFQFLDESLNCRYTF